MVYHTYEIEFRNNNPDKGTETLLSLKSSILSDKFRNNNPDKGTETCLKSAFSR